jgi:uncharacterized protein
MKNALNWFEIPVSDLDRACGFYEKVLAVPLRRETFFGVPNALFPFQEPGVGGALVRDERRPVTAGGSVIYIDATAKLDDCLARVATAGGAILQGRTAIGQAGFIALIRDSEGNTIGLHSAS